MLEMRERHFKSKAAAMKSLKWYLSRGYKAFYEFEKDTKYTKSKVDIHCITIMKF